MFPAKYNITVFLKPFRTRLLRKIATFGARIASEAFKAQKASAHHF